MYFNMYFSHIFCHVIGMQNFQGKTHAQVLYVSSEIQSRALFSIVYMIALETDSQQTYQSTGDEFGSELDLPLFISSLPSGKERELDLFIRYELVSCVLESPDNYLLQINRLLHLIDEFTSKTAAMNLEFPSSRIF